MIPVPLIALPRDNQGENPASACRGSQVFVGCGNDTDAAPPDPDIHCPGGIMCHSQTGPPAPPALQNASNAR